MLLLLNDDNLLTADHSGLRSEAFLHGISNASPCVTDMVIVSCCKMIDVRHNLLFWLRYVQLFWVSYHMIHVASCLHLSQKQGEQTSDRNHIDAVYIIIVKTVLLTLSEAPRFTIISKRRLAHGCVAVDIHLVKNKQKNNNKLIVCIYVDNMILK